ncbi:hypothetical protein ANO14919_111460 [Xylariales sp. No.14919]|nr:hypothetical protein ANO14919_111460 [Xylariales sp. No.14919]
MPSMSLQAVTAVIILSVDDGSVSSFSFPFRTTVPIAPRASQERNTMKLSTER